MERKRKIQAKLRRSNNLQRRRKYKPIRCSNYDVKQADALWIGHQKVAESSEQDSIQNIRSWCWYMYTSQPTMRAWRAKMISTSNWSQSQKWHPAYHSRLSDLNANVGKGTPEKREVLGQYGTGNRNENSERQCEFCKTRLVITETICQHKEIHKTTWISPNGRTKNQIDHTMIAKEYRSSVMGIVVRRGADVRSNHHLVKTVGSSWSWKETQGKRKIKENQIYRNQQMRICLSNTTLRTETDFKPWTIWKKKKTATNRMENIFVGAAKDVLGIAKRTSKPWLRGRTWNKVEERRWPQLKLESTHWERK